MKKINRIHAVYFSPCGNASLIARTIGEQLGKTMKVPVVYDDMTLPWNRSEVRQYGSQELVVFVLPVYAGRIPNKLLPAVQELFYGARTPVVPVVTYGNRSYDHALKELAMELRGRGFCPVAAAGVVAEHSFSEKLAGGRPNASDLGDLRAFADVVAGRLEDNGEEGIPDQIIRNGGRAQRIPSVEAIPGGYPLERYYTPLGRDGQPAVFLKAKPETDPEKCQGCGICVAGCPMGSIDREDPTKVTGICIKCQACIRKCPMGAKSLRHPAFLSHVAMLEEHYTQRRESEYYYL